MEHKGFSLVEVVLAGAVFGLLVSALVTAYLFGQEATATAGQRARAEGLADEGLEAVRNIRDDNYSNLTDGNHGLAIAGGIWTFSGVSDATDIFTRQVAISSVDADRKLVVSTVSWQQTPQRTGSVSATTYLTNWSGSVPPTRPGMLAYADTTVNGGDGVVYKTLNTAGVWSAPASVPDIAAPDNELVVRTQLYASSTRNEKILVTKHVQAGAGNDQYIFAQVWDGATWGNKVQLGTGWTGTAESDAQDFDGAYLNNGDFILVFDDNTTTPKYVTWDGASWTPAPLLGVVTGLPATTVGGNPVWITVENRPGTDQVMMAVLDASSDVNTALFDGTLWDLLPVEHTATSPTATAQGVDFVWSRNTTTTGALIYNEAADNFPNVKIWNGATWSASVENVDIGGASRSMQITDRPGADEFLACFKDAGADINCLETNFTPSWSALSELTAASDAGLQRSMSLGYESLSGDPALGSYASTTGAGQAFPKYRTYDPTTNTWSAESELATLTTELETVEAIADTQSDDIMLLFGASDQDLWTIVWDGATGAFYGTADLVQTEHGTNGTADTDYWFDFAWDLF
jgi:Tfp pilus assembly protein PilV